MKSPRGPAWVERREPSPFADGSSLPADSSLFQYEIRLPSSELDLPLCVSSGQVFRWHRLPDGSWLGVDGPNWYRVDLSETKGGWISHHVTSNAPQGALERYFRLETRLAEVESRIVEADPELAQYVARLRGLRVLRPSDPEEVLFTFLCTPNNNVERIARMVRELAAIGEPIARLGGETVTRFPGATRIAALEERELRERGFGYRARSIPLAARALVDRGEGWLTSLKETDYASAHRELCALPGVGPKVADCVALIGLGHLLAVPVDTHLWQAARRLYLPELAGKALTPGRYRLVGDEFRRRFGTLAGWAHQYLFYENLLAFRGASDLRSGPRSRGLRDSARLSTS